MAKKVSFTTKGGNKVRFQSKPKRGSSAKKKTTRKKSAYTVFAGKRMKLYIAAGYPAPEAMKAAARDWRDKQAGKKLAAKPTKWKGKALPKRRKTTTKRAAPQKRASTKRAAPKKRTTARKKPSKNKFDLDKFLRI
ncbi:hypothetical protein CMI47_09365 [Candidatus Pacearchaeota archaeon]|nr:hypothetical protein [Candidatus Pacearchaeota archaeon]|tara:strand:- start:727 stop:1134 length:408 start_codon:yes stop_codon:yes gene_type:complete